MFCYLSTDPKCNPDPIRHKSTGRDKEVTSSRQNTSNGTPTHFWSGDPPAGSPQGISHIIHRCTAARNDPKITNIRLHHGPRTTWEGRDWAGPIHTYMKVLKPLTKFLENIFRVVMPSEWSIYDKVQRALPTADLTVEISECFGLWSSRTLVLNAFTDIHVDLQDVCRGFCAIAPFGKFVGGNVCLPSLGMAIRLEVGKYSIVFNLIPLRFN
ncbi:hypothetical protein L873DRAFT_359565 [Choiromyces venosus 120613-1]|uniref:Uncharacterized protein n=1 Tax=Choiromyces venosus 120613-1 TaxID=1336337 RepID=A0A3N4J3C5_9PEZI|nr:hypothetical protein L873DRAFT_359565 [Choiromyces venosus 120613-1]